MGIIFNFYEWYIKMGFNGYINNLSMFRCCQMITVDENYGLLVYIYIYIISQSIISKCVRNYLDNWHMFVFLHCFHATWMI